MLSVPVPDVDRTDHLLMLGANPLVSNGSLLTAPDMRGRLRGIRERGGKVVVVDPRRTRTAEEADEHHFIRPGTDALLLAAMACTLFEEGLVDPGRARRARGRASTRSATLRARLHRPSAWRRPRGIAAEEIRRMARELAGRRPRRRLRPHRHHAPRSSARSPAGWSTCSTCSPATSTARAARCSPRAAAGQRNSTRRARRAAAA